MSSNLWQFDRGSKGRGGREGGRCQESSACCKVDVSYVQPFVAVTIKNLAAKVVAIVCKLHSKRGRM